MTINSSSVVTIDYTVKDSSGTVLEDSGSEPLSYIHGMGVLAPGLEKALEGKETGFELDITLSPDEAFGRRDEKLVLTVKKDDFENPEDVEEGLTFQAEIGDEVRYCTVQSINDNDVIIDANHPLADQTLNFQIAVKDVREATREELEHGHVHSDSGCGHC